MKLNFLLYFSLVQLLSCVQLFATPWTAAHQASLSFTNSQSLLKLMSTESVMPSNHLILCRPLLLQPSIFPTIRVFSDESVLHIRWPKYWSFSFSISPSNEYSGLISIKHAINRICVACVLSIFSLVWLFVTLWTVTLQAPLSMGFSRQEYWSGLPCSSLGYLPNWRLLCLLHSQTVLYH